MTDPPPVIPPGFDISAVAIEVVPMARSRRRFGPLVYLTAGLAVLLLASQPFWEPGMRRFRVWRLSRQLHDPDESVRREAADSLVQLGPIATWWVARALRDPDLEIRLLSCNTLARMVTDGDEPAAEALLDAIRDGDVHVRSFAVGQVERIFSGPRASKERGLKDRALRSLGAALADESPQVRRAAAWELAVLGPAARPTIGDLDRALDGPDISLRPLVANDLWVLDPEATRPRVIAAMPSLLADTSIPHEHFRVFWILNEAQGQDATAAMVMPLLRHPDPKVRAQAVNDLITYCPQAGVLKSAMIEGLASGDGMVRETAAVYLLKHDPGLVAKAVEIVAERILHPMEGGCLPADLVQQVREASPGSLAPLAKAVAERLPRAREPEGRFQAILTLGAIGPEARSAIPALLEASRSGDRPLASIAIEALIKIDPPSAATRIPLLLEWSGTGHSPAVRLDAMTILGELGASAKEAIPALLKMADEDDLPVASAAIEAIGRIDPARGVALKRGIEQDAVPTRVD